MQNYKKQYTITLRGKVQEIGFRGYLEDLCKRLRVPSISYNTSMDELKLLCETDQETLNKLSDQIREYRLAEITDLSIQEGVQLPYPPYRAVIGIEQEIYNRLDEGVKILLSIKGDTRLLQSIKEDTKKLDKLDKLDEKLGNIGKTLREISDKL